jgi:DNA adenine methylase
MTEHRLEVADVFHAHLAGVSVYSRPCRLLRRIRTREVADDRFDIIAHLGDDLAMRYSGGKGKSYPYLVNLMPPHRTYIESHLGGGAVMRHKLPAERQMGIDIDPKVIARWNALPAPPCDIICADATRYLSGLVLDPETLIYADPPYVPCTRKRTRVYRFDYTAEDHERMIHCLLQKRCMVMISGYDNDLYSSLLGGWTRVSFSAKTHSGVRQESVWLNYELPSRLHDARHLGSGFREREILRRRRSRLRSRIQRISQAEQYDLLMWLKSELGETQ